MQITTKAQAKTIVSALRREVKSLGKGPESLSHTDCLTLMAKALGFPSWNAWESTLMAAPAEKSPIAVEKSSKYPLVNSGDFDFIRKGTAGVPFSGMFARLEGLFEKCPCRADISQVKRGDGGESSTVELEYAGESDMFWDDQRPVNGSDGFRVWLDDNGTEISEGQMVMLPAEYDDHPDKDEELPIRTNLIQAFLDYIADNKVDAQVLAGDFSSIENIIGFGLTLKEEQELLKQLSSATQTA